MRLGTLDRVVLALATLGVLAAVVAARIPRKSLATSPPLCWSVVLLGRECPGCGLTRSFAAIGRGDVREANALNPLGPILLGYGVIAIAIRLGKMVAPRFRYWLGLDAGFAGGMVLAIIVRTLTFYFA